MTSSSASAPPTPVLACTVMEFATRLGISRRSALDLFGAAAAHLNVVVRVADSGRLTVAPGDFTRMIHLVETLNSVGLTIRQLHRIQQSQDPDLWSLLRGSRAPEVAAAAGDHPAGSELLARIEALFELHLVRQESLLRQHLSRPAASPQPAPVPPTPAPAPVPALARPRPVGAPQVDLRPDLPPRPMPTPVPVHAPGRVPIAGPVRPAVPAPAPAPAPTPARIDWIKRLEDQSED